MISQIEDLPGFEKGGRLYGGMENTFYAEKNDNITPHINVNEYCDSYSAVYGLEDFPLERLELYDGEFDIEKLKSGNYIFEGIRVDDNGRVIPETANYKVGDTVTLYKWRNTAPDNTEQREYVPHTFTVLGHVIIKTYTNTDRMHWGFTFYLPANVYISLVDTPFVMSYAFYQPIVI